MPTAFAPAARATDDTIRRQAEWILRTQSQIKLMDAVPTLMMILNPDRQIVFANQALLKYLGVMEPGVVFGRRPGEIMHCVHASETEGGCDTSEFCKTCGAVQSILSAQQGSDDVKECSIYHADTGDTVDLRVWATSLQVENDRYTVFAVADISHEKRRRALERIFFHDIINLAGSIQGLMDVFDDLPPEDQKNIRQIIRQSAHQMIEELYAQRDLAAAETAELKINPEACESLGILREVCDTLANHSVAKDRILGIRPDAEFVTFRSDPVLIRRVLINLTKNGLEACEEGQAVSLDCRRTPTGIRFQVHNPTVIPHDIQLQVFKRSFSTKGTGRGLGTYSVKLLSERYLKGHVSFSSTPAEGTTFVADYPLALT